MAEDTIGEVTTQTQTQNSQVDWSQTNTPSVIPAIIWGRLYSTKHSINEKNCWRNISQNQEYCDLIQPDFTLGRSLDCSFVMKKDIIKEDIIKNVSKKHFAIKRDLSEPLSPAIIVDLSYNGTFVNGEKIGKGNSRVLDDRDEIAITHPSVKMFCFKDLLKNEQDNVPKQISQKYYISRTLGQGACGIVKLVFDKKKCTKHAMKIVKKNKLTNGQLHHLTTAEKIMNEVYIMKSLRHPCIVSTEEVFNCTDAVYIVLELMQGGELFDRISKQGRLTERLTRFMFRQIVLAVRYLHSRGITHRDLKPENVLLESKEDDSLIKITDFGLSKFVGEDSFMRTMCGTPLYLAPEVLRANGQQRYGPEVDVWSLGVIFFICLVGYLPFSADYKDLTLREQILSGRYRLSQPHWRDVTPQARALMRRMLDVNVQRRITLDQILDHSWMQDADIIIRVERLLSQSMRAMESCSLLMDSSDQENNNSDAVSIVDLENNNNSSAVSVVSIVAKTKRALSDNSSCEPMSKKLKLTLFPDNADTSSASLYSEYSES